jgi:predicted transcriptional regulator
MTTMTTIRLEDELKARVAAAAERAGTTADVFNPGRDRRVAFDALADARWSMLAATGETVAWDDAKAWLEARARGETPPRPAARQVGV